MLTILTPTYNRRPTLPRLYESLCAQRRLDFEWLVVDDGSTDDTAAWLQSCRAHTPPFTVRTLVQANGGKHAALNAGVREARGDWIFIVDSDDHLTPDAVECVLDAVAGVSDAPQPVAGVCFRKADPDGRLIGLPYARGTAPFVGTPTQAGRMVRGDLAYVFRRDLMAELPFPIIPGEKFVPELYIWNRIGDRGPIRFYLDRAIYRCEYLDDGYTRNFRAHLRRNPGGFLLFYAAQIGREPYWMDKLKAAVRSVQCLVYCAAKAMAERKGLSA
ncbi:glycosyltransferase family 2 protein [Castellaniella ginsengisoli]|uniref:Glycosyltransferase family 2 protein n=1 Tax=Castellaniella ginsengisoli TaxID=546114 RepID=A0AB39CZ13_9BURK